MVLGKADTAKYPHAAAERCVDERQKDAQPRLHRLSLDLHRRFLVGRAERALRAVQGAEEEADEARDRDRPGA
jgi:hypothetical protein